MQEILRVKWLVAVAALLSSMTMAQAQEATLGATSASMYVQSSQPFMLAANETSVVLGKEKPSANTAPVSTYEPPLLTGGNIHTVLGLATIAAAGLAAVTASEGCEHNCSATQQERDRSNAHAQFGKAAGVLAVATVASGLISHWDDFSLEDGFTDPDNLHVLLGVTGAAMMAYAVNKSASTGGTSTVSHSGLAEIGALGMLVAIKLTW